MKTNSVHIILKVIASTLCVLIGATFIFSGFSKIPTLEQFGWTIVETTPFNWTLAEWSARLLIGLEIFLGVLFITHIKIKKIAIPLSIGLLTVFTIYLLLVIKVNGSSGNCGCFGEVLPMTPLQSVWKNVAMLVVIGIIFLLQHEFKFKYIGIITGAILLVALLIPFVMSPPESIYIYDKEKDIKEPIPLSILYNSDSNKPPTQELRKGKNVIAFMSLTCEHCRKAAKRMRIMKEKHPELPFYFVLNGDSTNLSDFIQDTKATNIPYSLFIGAPQFIALNRGSAVPSIKWIKDTTLVRESNYITLDDADILKWMKE